jgi:hypothetical protein
MNGAEQDLLGGIYGPLFPCHQTFWRLSLMEANPMRTPLKVATGTDGLPTAEVPFTCMWDLVEYLSYQRVAVSYQYEASHFTVSFPKQDMESAQQILNNWSKAEVTALQTA